MRHLSLKAICSFYLFCLISLASASKANADMNLVAQLKEKYDELPPKGKFATGAAVGFASTRVVVKSAVSVVKIAGAAYIATEVMNAAGVLDDVKVNWSSIGSDNSMKERALAKIEDFRTSVRTKIKPDMLKQCYQDDKMATLGVASGAVVGLLL